MKFFGANRLSLPLLAILVAALSAAQRIPGERVATARIVSGDLAVLFRDNADSPRILSGIQSLLHLKDSKEFNAFDPHSLGAAAGLNFEHIISGHSDPANRFTPRHGKYSLYKLTDEKSVILVRNREDCPWAASNVFKYTVNAPHYIDIDFRSVFHEPSLFGRRGYAIQFFADYMNDVAEVPIHFRGVSRPNGNEEWIAADAPNTHPDWNGGGTYRHARAEGLGYDADHNFKLNVWSYDYPRFTKPFYYGRMANGMVFLIMFDKDYNREEEVRFSLFKFKLPRLPRPAWDFQFVIHKVKANREYGFKARVVWKKFISREDCLEEYNKWAAGLDRNK